MWHTMFESSAKHINRAAPNVFLYLVQKYELFSTYEQQYSTLAMTGIRNNHDVRTLVCEVAATVAFCRKNKLPPFPKIKPEHDFQHLTIQESLKAPSASYGRTIALKDDPLEIYVPMNELVYCLRPETRDLTRALYWTAWMLKYSSQCKKQNKVDFLCNARPNPFVDDAYSHNIIWMLWEVVLKAAEDSPQAGLLKPYMDALFKLHCLRWSPAVLKNRIPFLMNAMMFVCESTTLDIHAKVPHDISLVQQLTTNVPQWISAILQTKKTFA